MKSIAIKLSGFAKNFTRTILALFVPVALHTLSVLATSPLPCN